jgi:hypothetical protein
MIIAFCVSSWHGPGVMSSSQHRNLVFIFSIAALFAVCLTAAPCRAQNSGSSGDSFGSAIVNYFADWFPRVTRIQSEQPHWVTPVVTVTP